MLAQARPDQDSPSDSEEHEENEDLLDDDDIPEAVGRVFDVLSIVGEGAFGRVYRARDSQGRMVALKSISASNDEEGVPTTTLREVALLTNLDHPNIVPLYQTVTGGGRAWLSFELCERDLRNLLMERRRENNLLPRQTMLLYMYQLADAMYYCHRNRLLHRDLKPQNVLIKGNNVKICDLGLARQHGIIRRPLTAEVVTLWYRAPEILLGAEYDAKVDMWSLGCIFAEMANLRALFPGNNEVDQAQRIFRTLGTPTNATWPGVESLPNYQPNFAVHPPQDLKELIQNVDDLQLSAIEKLLELNPEVRLNAKQLFDSACFDGLRP